MAIPLFRLVLWAAAAFSILTQIAYASEFGDAVAQGVNVIVDSDSQPDPELKTDLLVMNTPNANGISYNNISQFTLNRPLKIANTANSYSTGIAAKLIIIRSNKIELFNDIELLGETADILFVSTNTNALLTCVSCGFKNFGRVTLAAASVVNMTNTISSIGKLSSTTSGTVSVNGLSAPSIASLEFIANNIITKGHITTNLRAINHPAGGYELTSDGGVIVGNGGINIFARNMAVDYESLKVTRLMDSSNTLANIEGVLTSASINITTASPLTLKAELNTQSDVLQNTVYRGKLSATNERIAITTLGATSGNGHLSLNSILKSDNLISVYGSGDIHINNQIVTKNSTVVARGRIFNKSTIKVRFAEWVADRFENNGTIMSSSLKIVAEKDLQNRFGGKLLAENIDLASNSSVVRNGSQYPYRPASEGSLVLKPDEINTTDLSTINNLTFAGATKVADLSAKIIGKNITIDAYSNFENINPYFIYTKNPKDWENGIFFDGQAVDRVLLIAENTLKIKARQYVVNSSAIMGVNTYSTNKNFLIESPNIANERYFTRVIGDVEAQLRTTTNTTTTGSSTTVTTTEDNLVSNLYAYSPPGVIYSFSPLNFHFNNDFVNPVSAGFINNTSYFEVLADAYFTGHGAVTSIGLALEKENFNLVRSSISIARECTINTGERIFISSNCVNSGVSTTSSGGTTVANDMERTLFSVSGNIYGKKTTFFGKNHQSLDDIKQQVIQEYSQSIKNTWAANDQSTPYWKLGAFNSTISADGKNLILSQNYAPTTSPTTTAPGHNYLSISIWDLMVQKFAEIKAAFLAELDAFVAWWNS